MHKGTKRGLLEHSKKKVNLRNLRDEIFDPRRKMKPRWSGNFIIKKIMSGGATRIIDLDGE